jgi:hypothetical protein
MNSDRMEEQISQTMERLKHKIQLLYDTTDMWKTIAQNRACYPKAYYKAYVKSILKDTKQGLKEINKKNKVYLEMPTLKSVGNGQIQKVHDTEEVNMGDEEIEVNLPSTTVYRTPVRRE